MDNLRGESWGLGQRGSVGRGNSSEGEGSISTSEGVNGGGQGEKHQCDSAEITHLFRLLCHLVRGSRGGMFSWTLRVPVL